MSMRHWLRRNAAALTAAPVVLVVAFLVADDSGLIDLWRDERRSVPAHAAGEVAEWRGIVFRVDRIATVEADDHGPAWDVPGGASVVRVVVEATPRQNADTKVACRSVLIDADGRHLSPSPFELDGTSGSFRNCNPSFDDPTAAYEVELDFLVPPGATVHALRLGDVAGNDAVDLLVDLR